MKHFSLPKDGGLIEAGIPQEILHKYEKITTDIYPDPSSAVEVVAQEIVSAINAFDAAGQGRLFKLGMTTGKTMTPLCQNLVRKFEEGKVSFANVEAVAIDEYYPVASSDCQSRNALLRRYFFDKVDIKPENIHIPDGTVPQDKTVEYCAQYDKKASDMDILVMGFGTEGQVGFNEPGVSITSRTRTVLFPYKTRKIQAEYYNGNIETTPKSAITVGVATLLTAKRVLLMAWGEGKTAAVKRVVEDDVDASCPASYFQYHDNVKMVVDEVAGEALTRVECPWLVGPCEWTRKFRRKAVIWLCQKTHKPVLKLSHKDYLENDLDELLGLYNSYDQLNIEIFNDLQHTITGWPGGKPDADDSTRPVASEPKRKRVLIFSPHPDDDVISMGGTFIRLVDQGHDVHVAYETSGDVAVHDDVVIQHMDAARQLGFGDRVQEIKDIIASKKRGEAEPRVLLDIKAAIRRSEARGADRSFGLNDDTNVHFLNLPFYESGGIAKLPRTQVDVDIIKDLMKKIQPHQIYMAGDLADPHGTHRVCTEAALEALEQLKEEGCEWAKTCYVWLYRGAWMEWELGRVDMAVPLSPEELIRKRHAIYHHLSQKDIVPFPGDDPREFWQRAEERTQNTAKLYDELGMPEYQAIEVFLRLY